MTTEHSEATNCTEAVATHAANDLRVYDDVYNPVTVATYCNRVLNDIAQRLAQITDDVPV